MKIPVVRSHGNLYNPRLKVALKFMAKANQFLDALGEDANLIEGGKERRCQCRHLVPMCTIQISFSEPEGKHLPPFVQRGAVKRCEEKKRKENETETSVNELLRTDLGNNILKTSGTFLP